MADESQVTPTALLLCGDLFFGSKVSGTAESLGVRLDIREQLPAEIPGPAAGGYRLVILDLTLAGVSPAALMERLTPEDRPRVIAFGPHVATGKLQAARDAGCDEVLPRSRFSAELTEILSRAKH